MVEHKTVARDCDIAMRGQCLYTPGRLIGAPLEPGCQSLEVGRLDTGGSGEQRPLPTGSKPARDIHAGKARGAEGDVVERPSGVAVEANAAVQRLNRRTA